MKTFLFFLALVAILVWKSGWKTPKVNAEGLSEKFSRIWSAWPSLPFKKIFWIIIAILGIASLWHYFPEIKKNHPDAAAHMSSFWEKVWGLWWGTKIVILGIFAWITYSVFKGGHGHNSSGHTTHGPSDWGVGLIGIIILAAIIVGGMIVISNSFGLWPKENPEVEIIVRNMGDNSAVIYRGQTPWRGGENCRINVEVVATKVQCGKSVQVTCTDWKKTLYLVGCSEDKVDFPTRRMGSTVEVTAVKK